MHKKIITRKKTNRTTKPRKVEPIAHPVAKKLRLVRHAHTGRLVHRQHTSYGILLIFLVITGFLVFIGYDISSADSGGNISVGLTVPGNPPSQGAVITTPTSGTEFNTSLIDVVGTCSPTTAVIVYSNNVLAGSTLCTASGTFQLKIQLFGGANKITALNYDNLDQPGPVTDAVNVTYNAPNSGSSDVPIHPIVIPGSTETPPASCTKNPSADACHLQYTKTCDNYSSANNLPTGSDVRVAIVCMQRFANTTGDTAIGILLWGGHPPYALTIDWGDGSPVVLKSIEKSGYITLAKAYKTKGQYIVTLRASDKEGSQGYMQAMVDVTGPSKPNDFIGYIGNSINTSWFDSPVPTYFLAVAVVIGFWAGDYFERLILSSRAGTHGHRKRHA